MTVNPAKTTARPEVAIASSTAASGDPVRWSAVAVPGDDEERVVDADTDADHRRDLRHEARRGEDSWP